MVRVQSPSKVSVRPLTYDSHLGIYQQDDRDIRDDRKEQGLEPAYSFMIRIRMPAGVCRPEQWLQVDEIADRRGNGTFKLTTRQTFQYHVRLLCHRADSRPRS